MWVHSSCRQLPPLDSDKPPRAAAFLHCRPTSCPIPGLAEKLDERQGEPVDLGSDDFQCRLRREPLGVVAAISPWNYPRECMRVCIRAVVGPCGIRGLWFARGESEAAAISPWNYPRACGHA